MRGRALARTVGSRERQAGVVESIEAYVGDELGASERFIRLSAPLEIERREPIALQGERLAAFAEKKRYKVPATFVAKIPDARMVGSGLGSDALLMAPDHRLFLESSYDLEQLEKSPLYGSRLPRPRHLPGTFIAVPTLWYRNHFHWMTDLLPRFSLLAEAGLNDDLPLVLPGPVSRQQLSSLALVGIAESRIRCFDGTHWILDETYFPSLSSGTGNPSPHAMQWLRERLAPTATAGRRRLWVTRGPSAQRRVSNEPELQDVLSRHGFETLDPGSRPFAEQMSAFAEADVIAGPHGAGLTGMIAARAATVIEVFDPRYVNTCYYALADSLGHHYAYLAGEADDRGDTYIKPLQLEALLSQLLA